MAQRPHFLGIGAPRSGTSWLYDRLAEHPDFSVPPIKELHYFDRSKVYPSPNALSRTLLTDRLKDGAWLKTAVFRCLGPLRRGEFATSRWMLNWYFSNYNDQWYLSLFDRMDGISGEFSPAYMLLSDSDIKRVYELLPDLKVIFFMRDPIQRTWSSYRKNYLRRGRKLPDSKSIIKYLESHEVAPRVRYIDTLERYQKCCKPNTILVGFLDAIEEEPLETLQSVVQFLGGDTSKVAEFCSINQVSNPAPPMSIPQEIEDYLHERYRPLMNELSKRFGGYCTRWMNQNFDMNLDCGTLHKTFIL